MTRPSQKPLLKPPALQSGDTVGIVAPASDIKADLLQRGCEALQGLGYRPFYFESILERDLYFAGGRERRLREFHDMLEREDVRAILCARGGYGCNYLLSGIDLDVVARHPKIFMGYSDVTTLLTWFHDQTGLVTFHGPMVTKDFAEGRVDEQSWTAAVQGSANWELQLDESRGLTALVAGESEGLLYGGCLSMLAGSLGTPYEVQTAGTILFLEDVAAKPFQIDRMLMQLKLAGKFEEVRGIIFGEMMDCRQSAEQEYTLMEVVRRIVDDMGVPVAYGVSSGHVRGKNLTLPLGITVRQRVGTDGMNLKFLEPATIPAAVPARSAKR